MELVVQIFQVCIIPLLGILTTYFIKWLNAHMEELKTKTENATYAKYITLLDQTITDCVLATNQTYVNSLKEKGEFTLEAQQEAFNKTVEAVMKILNEDAKKYLELSLGDLNAYITEKIEANVNINKK